MGDESFCGSAMDIHMPRSSNSSSSSRKRLKESSDSEEEITPNPPISNNFAKFLIIKSEEVDKPVTKLSPFVIEKQLSAILGTPNSVKKLNNGTILVECRTKQQSQNLLKTKTFFGLGVLVSPHSSLNTSRGVITCKDLSDCSSLEEMKKELESQGVTDVRQISTWVNGKEVKTNTYVLTFNTPTLPSKIKTGYYSVDVRVYIPNPLRCYICQKFGHHEDRCKANQRVCMRCADQGHQHNACKNEVKCANCGEEHQANSKTCKIWQKEKEILKVKYSENLSFYEARQLVEKRIKVSQQSQSENSYANITKPKQVEKSTECETCKVLVDKLCQLFPGKALEIRQLVQSTTSVTTTASTSETQITKETEKQSNQKSVQKPTKPVKSNTEKTIKPKAAPKPKITLPEQSISKNTSTDKTSKDKNVTKSPNKDAKHQTNKQKENQRARLNRLTVDGENLGLVSSGIPVDKNTFAPLEAMDASDTSTSIWGDNLASWNDDPGKWEDANPQPPRTSNT